MCFSDYFRHLWNYNENKNHIYCVFRIILDTYGIITQNENHIYCVFRIIFRHLWNYNENKNHIYCVFRIILYTYGIIMRNENHLYCVFRIILDTYGIIMKIKIIHIVFLGLFYTLMELK